MIGQYSTIDIIDAISLYNAETCGFNSCKEYLTIISQQDSGINKTSTAIARDLLFDEGDF